jgi:hypothetical protein
LDVAAVARRKLEPIVNLLLLDRQIQQLGSGSDDPLRAFVTPTAYQQTAFLLAADYKSAAWSLDCKSSGSGSVIY